MGSWRVLGIIETQDDLPTGINETFKFTPFLSGESSLTKVIKFISGKGCKIRILSYGCSSEV
jgi:hypothetical protein